MKISVVIPVWNSVTVLERALNSVWLQNHKDFEVIVMDGASTDGTRELIEKHSGRIDIWRSEYDAGTTDAINKGINASTGELITILCADDYFPDPNVFGDVVAAYNADPAAQLLVGKLRVEDPTDSSFSFVSLSDPTSMHREFHLHLPGSFFKRTCFSERGFSEATEIANDYEVFAYLIAEKKVKVIVLDRLTSIFALGGRSSSTSTDFEKARDCFYVRRKYFGRRWAWPPYIMDIIVSSLRAVGFRPQTWWRKMRRRVLSLPGSNPRSTQNSESPPSAR
jgi:glycosyltransferase involved in cell wall biosynthesis